MSTKKERIMEEIKAGKTSREIAEAVGCAPQYVRDIAWQYQLELRRAARKTSVTSGRYPMLARLIREEYIGLKDIGEEIHLSREAVRSRIKEGWSFPVKDQEAIQRAFFPEVPVDKLFGPEDDLDY